VPVSTENVGKVVTYSTNAKPEGGLGRGDVSSTRTVTVLAFVPAHSSMYQAMISLGVPKRTHGGPDCADTSQFHRYLVREDRTGALGATLRPKWYAPIASVIDAALRASVGAAVPPRPTPGDHSDQAATLDPIEREEIAAMQATIRFAEDDEQWHLDGSGQHPGAPKNQKAIDASRFVRQWAENRIAEIRGETERATLLPPCPTIAEEEKILAGIRARNAKRTPGRWRWGTSNSFRRLSSDLSGKDGDVAYGCVHPHDRHPDIAISEADMAFIEGASEDIPAMLRLLDEYAARRSLGTVDVAKLEGEVAATIACAHLAEDVAPLLRDLLGVIRHMKEREGTIISALGNVADGGQYRHDIAAAISNMRGVTRDLAKVARGEVPPCPSHDGKGEDCKACNILKRADAMLGGAQ
jgi:hypothetical protein